MRKILLAGRSMRIGLAAAVCGALLAPAGLLAADETTQPAEPAMTPAPPAAALTTEPSSPTADKPVTLDASDSRGAIARYLWDLDGDATYEAEGGSDPEITTRLDAGPHRVGVRVVDEAGQTADAAVDFTVAAPPPADKESARPDKAPARTAEHPQRPRRERHRRATKAGGRGTVRAAASSAVTIQNFLFSPRTVTVNTGDTITWTNKDSAPHTATANDGSFNTGTLDQGESGSHTFTKAGTFAYICAIHPNMKGTVVVRGASSGGSSGSSGGSSGGGGGSSGGGSNAGAAGTSPGASASSGGSSGSGLPHTGLQLAVVVALGAAMIGGGALARRLSASL